MSAYTDDTIVRHRLLDEKLEFLQKPFDSASGMEGKASIGFTVWEAGLEKCKIQRARNRDC